MRCVRWFAMIKSQEQLKETYRLLEGDLTTLFKLVFTHRVVVAESDVRLASVILRKWLVDGLLGQLCHAGGWTPTLLALDNSAALAALLNQPSINYYLTAGVRFNGVPVMGVYNSSLPSTGAPLVPWKDIVEREFKLGEFLRQKRLFFDGSYFTCEEIIKYTANKLGGAHYDFDRSGQLAKLDEAASYMKFGGPQPYAHPPPSHIYLCLEPEGSEVLSDLHIEIIAAATSLIQLRLSGTPVMKLHAKKSWRTWVKEKFGQSKSRYKIYDYGNKN